jgi:renalase
MRNAPLQLAILGAGVSGLTLAKKIPSDTFEEIQIFEKSKAVGGRWATRRILENVYKGDHGAQFYTPDGNPWHLDWAAQGLSKKWFGSEGTEYWAALGGMNSLAKDLAKGISIQFERKIVKIINNKSDLHLIDDQGRMERADVCALSAPLPQTLEILRSSQVSYPKELEACTYDFGLVGFFQVPQMDRHGTSDAYLRPSSDSSILSFAWQNSKIPQSGQEALLVVQMKNEWSKEFFDEKAEVEILQKIWKEAQSRLNLPVEPTYQELKKWRYAIPQNPLGTDYLQVRPGLYIFGDSFGGTLQTNNLSCHSLRAFLSAESLAKELVSKFG